MNHSYQTLDELLHTVRRTENPSADDRRAVRRGISALFGTAVTTSTAVASAATKTAFLTMMVGPFVTGVVFGGAVIATTAVAYRPELFGIGTPPSVASPGRPVPRPHGEPPIAPSELAPPGELPSAAPALSDERPPEPTKPEHRTLQHRQAPGPAALPGAQPLPAEPRSPQTLEAESRALAEAQRALRDRDLEWALNMLAQQDRTFAGGVLAEERAAARVFTLCAAGRHDEGRASAERFQKQYPGSLLTERVRQACER